LSNQPAHRSDFSVTAIYHGNRFVLALISVLFVVMVALNAWLLTTAGREFLSTVAIPQISACFQLFIIRLNFMVSSLSAISLHKDLPCRPCRMQHDLWPDGEYVCEPPSPLVFS
jgi:hypothetical protein